MQGCWIIVSGVLLATFVAINYRGAPRWWTAGSLALPAAALGALALAAGVSWPVGGREISLLRSTLAAVATCAVLREGISTERFPAHRGAILGTLGLSALLAIAAFFNLFHPQFWDHEQGQPSAVHCYDMRVYYPTAKYIEELGFDGLYLASVAAAVDDDRSASLDSLGPTRLRDLDTHEMTTVAAVAPQIRAVRARFTPERWQAFRKDMGYFRRTMGTEAYLGSMRDHGANATPPWLTTARLLFVGTEASDRTLLATALLDPLLLLVMFVAIGHAFGLRAMLVAAVVFGANDFYMYNSNWVGSTLRHDWLAFLGIGIAALRRERWLLAGALLALAAAMRAFPAIVFVGIALPALWWGWAYRREHGGWPALSTIREHQRPLLRIAAGGAACLAVVVTISLMVLPVDLYGAWLRKVLLLSEHQHGNHVSLRTVLYSSLALRQHLPGALLPLLVIAAGLCTAAVALVARGKRPAQAAILGLMLVPVVFYPANYYLHLVFLIPLLALPLAAPTPAERVAKGRSRLRIELAMLGVCVAQYVTVLDVMKRRHFLAASVLLLIGLAVVLDALRSEAKPARG